MSSKPFLKECHHSTTRPVHGTEVQEWCLASSNAQPLAFHRLQPKWTLGKAPTQQPQKNSGSQQHLFLAALVNGARPRTELFMCCYPSPELIQALGSAVKFSSLWGPFTTTTANQPSHNKKQLSSRSHAGQKYSSTVRLCTTIFTSPRTSMSYRITKSLRLERPFRSPSPTIMPAPQPCSPLKPWPQATHPHIFTLAGTGLHHLPGQHLPVLDSWRNFP